MFYINLLLNLFVSASIAASGGFPGASIVHIYNPPAKAAISVPRPNIPDVPFYSQFRDISAERWQKLGCGIADLAMLIEFYKPGIMSVDGLLEEAVAAGAFVNGAGWSHRGLALLSRKYGLEGANYDFSHLGISAAFAQFEKILKEGPVIASVYYTFDPQSPIPHLAVINGIDGDTIYYNDPAEMSGGREISVSDFMRAWKKRFIAVRP